MRSIETEGATIDEAISRALDLLRLNRDEVDVAILENSSRGLLGFGGRKARIRATVRSRMAPSRDGASAVSQETEDAPGSLDRAIVAARRTLEEILRHLGVDEPRVDVSASDDGGWRFGLPRDVAGLVIGRHGQTLDAIEHLLKRVASHGSHMAARIVVDVDGYRVRRQAALEEAARRAADEALASGRPVVLEPMSPRDRRIIHLALSDRGDVVTHSEGEGAYRRVRIAPSTATPA
jgi:spoIIIJ-associated protein